LAPGATRAASARAPLENLRRLAEVLGAVHGQGLVQGRIDGRAVYYTGAATTPDFRLGGFEFCLRVAELNKAPLRVIAKSRPVGSVIFSFLDDWRALGKVMADLIGLDADKLDEEEIQFVEGRTKIDLRASEFERAQRLFLLGWLDTDTVKAAELVTFTALEALRDCYGGEVKRQHNKVTFARLLRHMPERDGLTKAGMTMNRRCGGGSVIPLLVGDRKPSLAAIRNDLAYGYPFDEFPWAGLLELIRDLIEYAYRRSHTEAPVHKGATPSRRVLNQPPHVVQRWMRMKVAGKAHRLAHRGARFFMRWRLPRLESERRRALEQAFDTIKRKRSNLNMGRFRPPIQFSTSRCLSCSRSKTLTTLTV